MVDLIQEGVPEPLREHMVFNGNRPSSSILITRLDVFAVGQLLALYEHRTAVQGMLVLVDDILFSLKVPFLWQLSNVLVLLWL